MTAHKGGCLGCHSDAEPIPCGRASVQGYVTALVFLALKPEQAALYLGALCAEHSKEAVVMLVELARANGLPIADLQARLNRLFRIWRETDA